MARIRIAFAFSAFFAALLCAPFLLRADSPANGSYGADPSCQAPDATHKYSSGHAPYPATYLDGSKGQEVTITNLYGKPCKATSSTQNVQVSGTCTAQDVCDAHTYDNGKPVQKPTGTGSTGSGTGDTANATTPSQTGASLTTPDNSQNPASALPSSDQIQQYNDLTNKINSGEVFDKAQQQQYGQLQALMNNQAAAQDAALNGGSPPANNAAATPGNVQSLTTPTQTDISQLMPSQSGNFMQAYDQPASSQNPPGTNSGGSTFSNSSFSSGAASGQDSGQSQSLFSKATNAIASGWDSLKSGVSNLFGGSSDQPPATAADTGASTAAQVRDADLLPSAANRSALAGELQTQVQTLQASIDASQAKIDAHDALEASSASNASFFNNPDAVNVADEQANIDYAKGQLAKTQATIDTLNSGTPLSSDLQAQADAAAKPQGNVGAGLDTLADKIDAQTAALDKQSADRLGPTLAKVYDFPADLASGAISQTARSISNLSSAAFGSVLPEQFNPPPAVTAQSIADPSAHAGALALSATTIANDAMMFSGPAGAVSNAFRFSDEAVSGISGESSGVTIDTSHVASAPVETAPVLDNSVTDLEYNHETGSYEAPASANAPASEASSPHFDLASAYEPAPVSGVSEAEANAVDAYSQAKIATELPVPESAPSEVVAQVQASQAADLASAEGKLADAGLHVDEAGSIVRSDSGDVVATRGDGNAALQSYELNHDVPALETPQAAETAPAASQSPAVGRVTEPDVAPGPAITLDQQIRQEIDELQDSKGAAAAVTDNQAVAIDRINDAYAAKSDAIPEGASDSYRAAIDARNADLLSSAFQDASDAGLRQRLDGSLVNADNEVVARFASPESGSQFDLVGTLEKDPFVSPLYSMEIAPEGNALVPYEPPTIDYSSLPDDVSPAQARAIGGYNEAIAASDASLEGMGAADAADQLMRNYDYVGKSIAALNDAGLSITPQGIQQDDTKTVIAAADPSAAPGQAPYYNLMSAYDSSNAPTAPQNPDTSLASNNGSVADPGLHADETDVPASAAPLPAQSSNPVASALRSAVAAASLLVAPASAPAILNAISPDLAPIADTFGGSAQAQLLQGQTCASNPSACLAPVSGQASVYKAIPNSINCASDCTMANGQPFDESKLTFASDVGAANLSDPFGKGGLPLNTVAIVAGPKGSVAATVTDTGVFNQPQYNNRVADLSPALASAVGVPGIGQVTITPLALYSTPAYAQAVAAGINAGKPLAQAESDAGAQGVSGSAVAKPDSAPQFQVGPSAGAARAPSNPSLKVGDSARVDGITVIDPATIAGYSAPQVGKQPAASAPLPSSADATAMKSDLTGLNKSLQSMNDYAAKATSYKDRIGNDFSQYDLINAALAATRDGITASESLAQASQKIATEANDPDLLANSRRVLAEAQGYDGLIHQAIADYNTTGGTMKLAKYQTQLSEEVPKGLRDANALAAQAQAVANAAIAKAAADAAKPVPVSSQVPAAPAASPAATPYAQLSGDALKAADTALQAKLLDRLKGLGYAVDIKINPNAVFYKQAQSYEKPVAPITGVVSHVTGDSSGFEADADQMNTVQGRGECKGSSCGATFTVDNCATGKCEIALTAPLYARTNQVSGSPNLRLATAGDFYNWNTIGIEISAPNDAAVSPAAAKTLADIVRSLGEVSGQPTLNQNVKPHYVINPKEPDEGKKGAAAAAADPEDLAYIASLQKQQAAQTAAAVPNSQKPTARDLQSGLTLSCSLEASQCAPAFKRAIALEHAVEAKLLPANAKFEKFTAKPSTIDAAPVVTIQPSTPEAVPFANRTFLAYGSQEALRAADLSSKAPSIGKLEAYKIVPSNGAVATKMTPAQAQKAIDDYIFGAYQMTPKIDSTGNFTWKDPAAAEHMGKDLESYVIGGMDPTFRLSLYNLIKAAEKDGVHLGITAAYRDFYRQSLITKGFHAAPGQSQHEGSCDYGCGRAADFVGINGTSKEAAWNWIDQHGQELGLARPILPADPPHVAPTNGPEFARLRGTPSFPYDQAIAAEQKQFDAMTTSATVEKYNLIDPATGKVAASNVFVPSTAISPDGTVIVATVGQTPVVTPDGVAPASVDAAPSSYPAPELKASLDAHPVDQNASANHTIISYVASLLGLSGAGVPASGSGAANPADSGDAEESQPAPETQAGAGGSGGGNDGAGASGLASEAPEPNPLSQKAASAAKTGATIGVPAAIGSGLNQGESSSTPGSANNSPPAPAPSDSAPTGLIKSASPPASASPAVGAPAVPAACYDLTSASGVVTKCVVLDPSQIAADGTIELAAVDGKPVLDKDHKPVLTAADADSLKPSADAKNPNNSIFPDTRPPSSTADPTAPSTVNKPGAQTYGPGKSASQGSGGLVGGLESFMSGVLKGMRGGASGSPASSVPNGTSVPLVSPSSGSNPSGAAGGQPTVTLSALPSTVATNATTTLYWTSANASSCALFTQSGISLESGPTRGSTSTLPVAATTIYVARCQGTGGTAQAQATVYAQSK